MTRVPKAPWLRARRLSQDGRGPYGSEILIGSTRHPERSAMASPASTIPVGLREYYKALVGEQSAGSARERQHFRQWDHESVARPAYGHPRAASRRTQAAARHPQRGEHRRHGHGHGRGARLPRRRRQEVLSLRDLGRASGNPVISRDEQTLTVITILLVTLAALTTNFTAWATVLDGGGLSGDARSGGNAAADPSRPGHGTGHIRIAGRHPRRPARHRSVQGRGQGPERPAISVLAGCRGPSEPCSL